MKNLKHLIFTAHAELKSKIPSIKISHVYEAFAAFCGFKSYAAFRAASEITFDNIEQAQGLCFERMQLIGFDASSALLICQRMEELSKQYNSIALDDIYEFYSEALFEDAHVEIQMLEALKAFVTAGDSDAALLGLVFTTQLINEYDKNPDNRSADYWYNKMKANHEISSLQREVIKAYLHIKPYRELLDFLRSHLNDNNDIVLPSPSAIKEFNEQFNDGVERHWTQYFYPELYAVLEAFDYINNDNGSAHPIIPEALYRDWQKAEAITFPNRGAIAAIIKSSISNEEKWFWYYVGLQHGVDDTQSNLRAINADTGEDYDDYGPMDVVGDEGISMPEVSEVLEYEMQKLASHILANRLN